MWQEIPEASLFCNHCGEVVRRLPTATPPLFRTAPLPSPTQPVVIVRTQKSPGLAAVLSFFICGLGQIYNGQIGKGLAFLFGVVMSWLLTAVIIGVVPLLILTIWSVVDAYKTAEQLNANDVPRLAA